MLLTALTQYINYNMSAYLTNRRYKDCLPKNPLTRGNLMLFYVFLTVHLSIDYSKYQLSVQFF